MEGGEEDDREKRATGEPQEDERETDLIGDCDLNQNGVCLCDRA